MRAKEIRWRNAKWSRPLQKLCNATEFRNLQHEGSFRIPSGEDVNLLVVRRGAARRLRPTERQAMSVRNVPYPFTPSATSLRYFARVFNR